MGQRPVKVRPSQSAFSVWHVLLLTFLCFAVYSNVLTADFVWDDHFQVVRNGNIRSVDNIPRAFVSSLWSFEHTEAAGPANAAFDRYYRPMQTVIYALTYQVNGLSAATYHVANVALHAIATILVYLLCIELRLGSLAGLIAGLLFAAHPVHTEAVSWIAGVGDLECAIFYFAALWSVVRYLRLGTRRWLWFSSICFLGALLSKEVAVTLPFVILLIVWMNGKEPLSSRALLSLMWPYVVTFGVYALMRFNAVGVGGLSSEFPVKLASIDWITMTLWVTGQYFRYAIAPHPLFIFHLVPLQFSDRVLSTCLYTALLLVAVGALWQLRKKVPNGVFWLAMFGTSLAPALYFKGISGAVLFAERYLYIPSLPMVVLMGIVLVQLERKRAILAACCITMVFATLTVLRNQDWRTEETLYARTLELQPEAVNIWTSLGEIYLKQNKNAQAREYFEKALQHTTDSRFVQVDYEKYRIYLQLGTVAAREKKPTDAKAYLKRALEIYDAGDGAYTQLGGVLINEDHDYDNAVVLLEKAIRLSATNELARDYMGVALFNKGQHEQAVKYFREALQINPDYLEAKQHLEVALKALPLR
jgi:Tfp pilus assembly protein PilF